MSIDDDNYNKPAIQGDVANVAIHLSVALDAIMRCLIALSKRDDLPTDDVAHLKEISKVLEEQFDFLTGWAREDSK